MRKKENPKLVKYTSVKKHHTIVLKGHPIPCVNSNAYLPIEILLRLLKLIINIFK